MKFATTFYLSRVIGNTVYGPNDERVGKLLDIVVDLTAIRPKAIAAKVKMAGKIVLAPFHSLKITKQNAQYRVECTDVNEITMAGESDILFLVRDVLDKQIVDMFGRKVVRVNDLRLAVLSNGTYLVAVDVGFEGFLRRLGVAKPLKKVLEPFNVSISSNLLLWDEVEAIDHSIRGLKLGKTYTKLSTMHPSDLADILEDLDHKTQLEIFHSLDGEMAADVLEEMETDTQVQVLESMTVNEAALMLEKLPSDEAADILDELHQGKAHEILMAMETESRDEIRELMEYPDDTAGSLMNTDFVTLSKEESVQDAIRVVRQIQPEAENVHSLYMVDDSGRLQGAIDLRDLVVSNPEENLRAIVNSDPIFVYDNEDVDEVASKMAKYHLTCIPVINKSRELIGMVILSDVLDTFMTSRGKRH